MSKSPYYKIEKGSSVFGLQSNLSKFIKELLLKEYKIYEVSQKRGDLVPYHCHNHKEIILLLEGKMRLIIEEDIIDIEAGEVLTIEAWAIHLACFPQDSAKFFLCFPKK